MTIFVILGVVILASVLLVWLLSGGIEVSSESSDDPRVLVRSCVEELFEESLEGILLGGGEIEAELGILYQGDVWNYLCYQGDYYLSCYNLHPMLEQEVEAELVADTVDGVQECFNLMRSEYEEMGYDVSGGTTEYSVDLLPGFIEVTLDKDVAISGDDENLAFDDFGFEFESEIYDLVEIARLIVNDESQYCNFEYNGYMLLYPEFDISRIDYKDSKLYSIMDRESGEVFRFAVRSCAMAPGM